MPRITSVLVGYVSAEESLSWSPSLVEYSSYMSSAAQSNLGVWPVEIGRLPEDPLVQDSLRLGEAEI